MINEVEIYISLINKLEKTINNLESLKYYSQIETDIEPNYLNELKNISSNINDINIKIENICNEYIYKCDDKLLLSEDKNKKIQININKKLMKICIPYIIYTKINLENNLQYLKENNLEEMIPVD